MDNAPKKDVPLFPLTQPGDAELRARTAELIEELEDYRTRYEDALLRADEASREALELRVRVNGLQHDYDAISHAFWWRITGPIRAFSDMLRRLLRRSPALAGEQSGEGPSVNVGEILARQREESREAAVRFSLLLPLCGSESELPALLDSLRAQTYPHWQLCAAGNGSAAALCQRLADGDHRILTAETDETNVFNAALSLAEGDYLAVLGEGDILPPAALFEVAAALSENGADMLYTDEAYYHKAPSDAFDFTRKPEFCPDDLRGHNYLGHLTVFRRTLQQSVGGFDPTMEGAAEYDMILRLSEQAEKIELLPKMLCFRKEPGECSKEFSEAGLRAVEAQLRRQELQGCAEETGKPGFYRIRYALPEPLPKVSILIPTQEHFEDLSLCLESLFDRTTYPNFEVILIENGSCSDRIFRYYEIARQKWPSLRVVQWDKGFNYSSIINFGASFASGEYLLLLNNDTKILTPGWIEELLMYAQRPDVGAVGALLLYPDDTVQHAGVIFREDKLPIHANRFLSREEDSPRGQLLYVRDMDAVTGACVLTRRSVWDELGGLDETFEVAYNDIDYCMRLRKAGYRTVWTPFAVLCHFESKSRGLDDTPRTAKRLSGESQRFLLRWEKELAEEKYAPLLPPELPLWGDSSK